MEERPTPFLLGEHYASSVPIVSSGAGDPPWVSSSTGSSRSGNRVSSRFVGLRCFTTLPRPTEVRFLATGRLLETDRRLAIPRRLLLVRRFEVDRRLVTVRRFAALARLTGRFFFRDERELVARFFRFAMYCLLSGPSRSRDPKVVLVRRESNCT